MGRRAPRILLSNQTWNLVYRFGKPAQAAANRKAKLEGSAMNNASLAWLLATVTFGAVFEKAWSQETPNCKIEIQLNLERDSSVSNDFLESIQAVDISIQDRKRQLELFRQNRHQSMALPISKRLSFSSASPCSSDLFIHVIGFGRQNGWYPDSISGEGEISANKASVDVILHKDGGTSF